MNCHPQHLPLRLRRSLSVWAYLWLSQPSPESWDAQSADQNKTRGALPSINSQPCGLSHPQRGHLSAAMRHPKARMGVRHAGHKPIFRATNSSPAKRLRTVDNICQTQYWKPRQHSSLWAWNHKVQISDDQRPTTIHSFTRVQKNTSQHCCAPSYYDNTKPERLPSLLAMLRVPGQTLQTPGSSI